MCTCMSTAERGMAHHGGGGKEEGGDGEEERITLVQRQKNQQPRDPGKMAELQVTELDKFAKRLREKRAHVGESMEKGARQVQLIDHQIDMIMSRYKPLLERLEYRRKERERVKSNLEACLRMEAQIMEGTRVETKKQLTAGSHVSAKFAALELNAARGFSCAKGTTFSVRRSKSSSSVGSGSHHAHT